MTDLNERAAQCMRWTVLTQWHGDDYYENGQYVTSAKTWHPTTDISQAWMLVEKCQIRGMNILVSVKSNTQVDVYKGGFVEGLSVADTAPEAITRACVEALEHAP